jgi:hypothetical protein
MVKQINVEHINGCVWYLFLIISLFALATVSSAEEAWSASGVVESRVFDGHGQIIERDMASGLKLGATCQFNWHQKDSRWYFDLRTPDGGDSSVLKSIFPIPTGGFVVITDYQGIGNTATNAYVTISTNRYLPAESIHGWHALWLAFEGRKILEKSASNPRCPPFFAFDDQVNRLQIDTHEIRREGDFFDFWNTGRFFERDSDGRIVFDGLIPKSKVYQNALKDGFTEARLEAKSNVSIGKMAVLTYYNPIEDLSKKKKFDLKPFCEIAVLVQQITNLTQQAASFEPHWTNGIALIVDHRFIQHDGNPLTYYTRDKVIKNSEQALAKSIKMNDYLSSLVEKDNGKLKGRSFIVLLLMFFSIALPISLWIFHRVRQVKASSPFEDVI